MANSTILLRQRGRLLFDIHLHSGPNKIFIQHRFTSATKGSVPGCGVCPQNFGPGQNGPPHMAPGKGQPGHGTPQSKGANGTRGNRGPKGYPGTTRTGDTPRTTATQTTPAQRGHMTTREPGTDGTTGLHPAPTAVTRKPRNRTQRVPSGPGSTTNHAGRISRHHKDQQVFVSGATTP